MTEATSVVLAGVHGHGRWHLRNLERLSPAARLAGICDLRPPETDVPTAADLEELLERVRPDVTVVCTPIHTHVDLALTAAKHGSHVLLEKPPAPTLAEFERLAAGFEATDRVCQIGFQSLGSHALSHVRALIDEGAIGAVRGIGAAGAWQRDTGYYGRARWAGCRTLDGIPVVDGALTNPFAHAIANALAIDGSAGEPRELDVELYRANDIEADDTSCLRLVSARGTPIAVAATLCAEREVEPHVIVHGARGRIVLEYRRGRVRLETDEGVVRTEHGSTDLLENLVAHVREGARLLVPPEATRPFMRVLEAVRSAPEPREIAPRYRRVERDREHPLHVVPGATEAVVRVAHELTALSTMDLAWMGR
ncbi:Gfo/Idh/MocA family oxidoreductase [Saccharopolyspora halophila]|uniref:Gfo/Idh/MocA family oxidoreductase n=1 Tax=Saccharopolyspora halophila TaxID=405551 RepID=A0ABN3G510_9PSEU